MTFDEIRKRNPGVGFAVYAIEPYGPVTFEAHTPDGQVLSWQGWTLEQALTQAFPAAPLPAPEEPQPEDVFG